jgi:diguanylate cyclase (GGDEF)-like protein
MCVVLVALLAGFAGLIRSHDANARRALDDRFETRAALTASFAWNFVEDMASREVSQAERLLAGETVDQASFESVVAAFAFEAAVLLDDTGRLLQVWPAKPELLGRDMTGTYEHLGAALAGSTGVSEMVPSAAQGMPITAVAVPFESSAGRRVLSGAFSPVASPLGAYLKSVVPVRGGTAFLIDRSGHVLTGEDDAVGSEVTDLGPGIHQVGAGKERVTAAVADVPGSPWRVVLAAPSDGLYAPVSGSGLFSWVLWLAFAIAGGLAIVLFVHLGRARSHAATTARTDVLTGLLNRRAMHEALHQAAAIATRHDLPLAALMIDIDHFKAINDTHGHDVGDIVLKATALALLQSTRAGDTVGRWGGEEFLVVLPHTDRDAALAVAERVRAQVAGESAAGDGPAVTVSIGVGLYDPDDPRLLGDADAALYAAKGRGRDRVEVRSDPVLSGAG